MFIKFKMTDYGIICSEIIYKLTDYGVGIIAEYEAGSDELLDYRIACPSCSNVFEEVWFGSVEQAVDYYNLHKDDCYVGEGEYGGESFGLGYWLDYVKNK